MIAFGKLSGKYKFRLFQGAPVVFKGPVSYTHLDVYKRQVQVESKAET